MANNYTYYYQGAFKDYIKQFMRLFSGFQVEYNRDSDNDTINDKKTCPVYYGSPDRIVANVLHKDGVSYATALPLMSTLLTAIELNPENRRTNYHEENVTRTRSSDGAHVVNQKVMGVPYRITIDLSIYTSNTNQMFQLLEQIMIMFNPKLTIQKSDNLLDWSYLTEIELVAVTQETNIPSAVDERMVMWSLSFLMDVWLDYPMIESTGVIQQIITTIKDNTFDSAGIDLDTFIVDQNTNPKDL